ncbi:cytochrome C oxidase subunit IV family protein [Sporichthya sp.]|uniref:cytochrome C oxidase subunit IV family protein n=1 Tax=Sporichthya sp. TaxID=65475 RepID=UPI0017FACCE5|nr:cytochrome C oxidase subunit IV family protein [Sporichthya sp.]MBA3744356.1 cytochrome C oxidase subunit IV family protein [Sporichthya sp.]
MTTSRTADEMAQDMAIVEKNIAHAGRPITIVWVVLMLATCVSWYFGDGHGATKLAAVLVIITGFVKVYLIMEHFMELRTAPPQLRFAFTAWCVVIPTILCGIYLVRS